MRADLSRVRPEDEARLVFDAWRDDIETNPELWRGGCSTQALRRIVDDWMDGSVSGSGTFPVASLFEEQA